MAAKAKKTAKKPAKQRRRPATPFTAAKKKIFLDKLSEFPHVGEAAAAAGMSRVAMYNHRGKDPDFADQWDKALKVGDMALLDIAVERGRKKSDTLLIFMIKGKHPQFRDKLIDLPQGGRLELNINTGPPPADAKKKKAK